MATSELRLVSCARYVSPKPPCPEQPADQVFIELVADGQSAGVSRHSAFLAKTTSPQ